VPPLFAINCFLRLANASSEVVQSNECLTTWLLRALPASLYAIHVKLFHQCDTSCPFAQEAHQYKASDQTEEADGHLQRAGVCEGSMEPFNKPHLSHTNP